MSIMLHKYEFYVTEFVEIVIKIRKIIINDKGGYFVGLTGYIVRK
ncbi:hypothetical protein HMPREF0496_0796 [Lentilactobacillus hilgardii ATCC 27305]|nr:hypothetical protein HMPREF0496_0796 [Lentilactobacillus hilgardii ATCC 27305]